MLVGYVMHDESMLLTDRRDVFPEMDYLVAKHRDAARAHGVELDEALFLRWVARGHRRAGRRRRAAQTYLRAARELGDVGAIPRALLSFAPETVVDLSRKLGARRAPIRAQDATRSGAELDRALSRLTSVTASSSASAPTERSDGPKRPSSHGSDDGRHGDAAGAVAEAEAGVARGCRDPLVGPSVRVADDVDRSAGQLGELVAAERASRRRAARL